MALIDILLATYNGEPFLGQQLESIFAQTSRDWHLTIRDDGSSDATQGTIEEWRSKHPDRINVIVGHQQARSGPAANYVGLMQHTDSPYCMFCDQDDVWLPTKVEVTLERMRALTSQSAETIPSLVFTDLKVVDERLTVLSESLWRYRHFNPEHTGLNLLTENIITGCTVMLNRALREIATPVPEDAVMHDWWAALLAAMFGRIAHVPAATMLYRQHTGNDTGVKERGIIAGIKRSRLLRPYRDRTIRQAAALYERALEIDRSTELNCNQNDIELVRKYAGLLSMGFLERKAFLATPGILRGGILKYAKLALF
jgi:glycosyltransferase involved in cell wall biosynthesis